MYPMEYMHPRLETSAQSDHLQWLHIAMCKVNWSTDEKVEKALYNNEFALKGR